MRFPLYAKGALFLVCLLIPSSNAFPTGEPAVDLFSQQTRPETRASSRGQRPDLDIAYIARTPRYSRYILDYSLRAGDPWRIPRLCPGTENDKRWPSVGESVTYTAHVINKGGAGARQFNAQWRVNGDVVATEAGRGLGPGRSATFELRTVWPATPERIEFRVDPDNVVAESVETQNALTIGSHDLTISIWVEQGLYDIFNATRNLVGSFSFEDWIQAHFAQVNQRFAAARYPVARSGIRDRVRSTRSWSPGNSTVLSRFRDHSAIRRRRPILMSSSSTDAGSSRTATPPTREARRASGSSMSTRL